MGTNELRTVLESVLPKEHGMSTGDIIALIASIAAIASFIVAYVALRHSRKFADAAQKSAEAAQKSAAYAQQANSLAADIAKRTGVIELHNAWKGVNRFDPTNPIFPSAINAANALDLTASLWNHDVLEKEILFQSYWKWFSEFHRVLSACNLQLPNDHRRVCDLISPAVKLAYQQMEERELKSVRQTNLSGK